MPDHDYDIDGSFPDTGWRGHPEIPSNEGGDGEIDYLNKPPYKWTSERDLFKVECVMECFCGKVQFEIHGDPLDAKYCHCHDCQRLHGAPFQWAVIFPKTSVRMSKNVDNSVCFYNSTKCVGTHYVPCKVSCVSCRSPLFDEGRNTVLAYPGSFLLEDHAVPHAFIPSAHIFYSRRIMDVPDDIPKWAGHKNRSQRM